jgi:hypothetical protein
MAYASHCTRKIDTAVHVYDPPIEYAGASLTRRIDEAIELPAQNRYVVMKLVFIFSTILKAGSLNRRAALNTQKEPNI